MAEMTYEYYREQVKRRNALLDEIVDLVVQRHGGFSKSCLWINMDSFTPGSRTIGVDGYLNSNDLEILMELLLLPSPEEKIEDFDFKKFEDLRDSLRKKAVSELT